MSDYAELRGVLAFCTSPNIELPCETVIALLDEVERLRREKQAAFRRAIEAAARVADKVADETRGKFCLGYVPDAPGEIGKVNHKATQYSERIAAAIRAIGDECQA